MDSIAQKAQQYLDNLIRGLAYAAEKIAQLEHLSPNQAEHNLIFKKLQKSIPRATTNMRLFQQQAIQLPLSTELSESIRQNNAQLDQFARRFIMRNTLPENALSDLKSLPLIQLQRDFRQFLFNKNPTEMEML